MRGTVAGTRTPSALSYTVKHDLGTKLANYSYYPLTQESAIRSVSEPSLTFYSTRSRPEDG